MNLSGRQQRFAQALRPCRRAGGPRTRHSRRASRPHRHDDLSASAGGCDSGGLVRRPRSRVVALLICCGRDPVLVPPPSGLIPRAAGLSVGTLAVRLSRFVAHGIRRCPAARRASAPRERANGSARSCSSPSTCTGRATRSIASPGRSSPSGSPTRRRVNPKSAKRAGKSVSGARRRRLAPAPRDARCAPAVSGFRACATHRRRRQALCIGVRHSCIRRSRAVRGLSRRRPAHHRAQARRGRTPRTPVVPGIDGPHQPRDPGKQRPRKDDERGPRGRRSISSRAIAPGSSIRAIPMLRRGMP